MQLLNTLDTSSDATSVLEAADQLITEFGADNVSGAYQNMTLAKFIAALKSLIGDNPSLSEPVKELAYAKVDSTASDVVADTTPGATDAVAGGPLDEAAQSDVDAMMQRIMMDTADRNDEDSGAGSTEGKKSKQGGEAGGGNWLENLAQGLAEAQSLWLDKAQGHLETMKTEAGSDDSKLFTEAQSKYSAAMQMFSMTAAAASTSIKSVGEGLAGIARKQ